MKTVSLELAKQLKEAGYPQTDCDNYWKAYEYKLAYRFEVLRRQNDFKGFIAAPTADEILDLLPTDIDFPDGNFILFIVKTATNDWGVFYKNNSTKNNRTITHYANSLADAAAKIWLYLKKEGLLASDNGQFKT